MYYWFEMKVKHSRVGEMVEDLGGDLWEKTIDVSTRIACLSAWI